MLRAKNFLKDYYNQYPDNEYTDFLKSFGCYMYFDTIYNEIKQFKIDNNPIKTFNSIIDKYYDCETHNLLQHNEYTVTKSVIETNLKQFENLKKVNFNIDIVKDDFTVKKFKINKNRPIRKRKIILFYKTGDDSNKNFNKSTKVGVDIFQTCIIYKVIEKLIKDRYIKNFNDVIILPKYKNNYPKFIEKDLKYNIKWLNHPDYINECCLYANVFHFYGGTVESTFAYSKPIISSTIAIQRPYVKHFKDYFYIPFYYHKGKVDGYKIKVDGYDGDKELQMRFGLKGFNYCERMMKNARNNSLQSLISTLITQLVLFDNTL